MKIIFPTRVEATLGLIDCSMTRLGRWLTGGWLAYIRGRILRNWILKKLNALPPGTIGLLVSNSEHKSGPGIGSSTYRERGLEASMALSPHLCFTNPDNYLIIIHSTFRGCKFREDWKAID